MRKTLLTRNSMTTQNKMASLKKMATVCLIGTVVLTALAGCGRKGGLYLPENVKQDNEKNQPVTTDDNNDTGQ
jgi:predicted small lipoprotein YifL